MVVNFGLIESFRNSSRNELSFADLYRKHLDLAVEAEDLGYDTIWLTEHHFVEDGYSPSMLPLAAAIAARTRKIRIGTFVLLLPLRHPLEVAEDGATVDVLSNGRFDLGLGQGYRPQEFAGFNIPRNERSSRLHEGVEIIRRAWTEENLSFEGKYHKVTNVTVYPRVVQKPHPPLWIGARSRKATEYVARSGYHLAGASLRQARLYIDALRAAGRNPEDFNIAQLRFGYIAAKQEKAWDDAGFALHHLLSCYGKWIAEAGDRPGDEAAANVPPVGELRQAYTGGPLGRELLVGTPEDAIRKLESELQQAPFTHLALGIALPGLDPRKVRNSMKLFAREVIPHFRRKARAAKKSTS